MIHESTRVTRSSLRSQSRKEQFVNSPASESKRVAEGEMSEKNEHVSDDEEDTKGGGKGSGKSRRELPAGAVATLKAWLLSPEHFTHPYPTPQDQVMLMQKTGIDKKQLKNWFTNARRRIWKPMLKKQLEQGKLAATGAGGGGVAVPGVVPGLMVSPIPGAPAAAAAPGTEVPTAPSDNPHSVQAMHAHYQQAVQQQHQHQQHQPQQQAQQSQQPPQQQFDQFGNPVYVQQSTQQAQQPNHPGGQPQPPAPAPASAGAGTSTGAGAPATQSFQQYFVGQSPAPYGQVQSPPAAPAPIASSSSIGSLPAISAPAVPSAPAPAAQAPLATMNKTDSHAVLMELFARDQDLVRQATESAKMKAAAKTSGSEGGSSQSQPQGQQVASQHPMKIGSQTKLVNVPTLNSWPHFSSISSLNNLGTMTGVKSITSMSGADLASQGNLNKMGNLAQVKSIESMGKNDSYAFLEVFFGDRSMNMAGKEQRGVKREREEDGDVGLSLDADESPSTTTKTIESTVAPAPTPGAPQPAPLAAQNKDKDSVPDTGTLKRAYDDALAARGLISVSRSCEKLTDLALPAKMQKTLSQEYLRQHQAQAQAMQTQQQAQQQQAPEQQQSQQGPQQTQSQQQYSQFSYSAPPPSDQPPAPAPATQQYPGQHPGQQAQAPSSSGTTSPYPQTGSQAPAASASLTDPSSTTASSEVQVPSASRCARCHATGVDTQLRPCGHMFHERCLKPSLQVPIGQPKCPIDNTPIQSALLAVPTDEVNDDPICA